MTSERTSAHAATFAVLNVAALLSATVFSAAALGRPALVQSGGRNRPLPRVLAAAAAGRTWAVTAPLIVGILRRRPPSRQLLIAAGLFQLGDATINVWQRSPRAAAPGVMSALHLVSAWAVGR